MHEQSACGGEEKESVQGEQQSERRCRRCFQNDSRELRSNKCAIVWARTWTARILFGLLVRIGSWQAYCRSCRLSSPPRFRSRLKDSERQSEWSKDDQ